MPLINWSFNAATGQAGTLSAQVSMLPFLECEQVYSSMNFSRPTAAEIIGGRSRFSTRPDPANGTAAVTVISVLLCPSDPMGSTHHEFAGANYRTNMGTMQPPRQPGSPPGEGLNGAFDMGRSVGLAEFTDGLSTTVAFSEKPRGKRDVEGFSIFTGFWMHESMLYSTPEELIATCYDTMSLSLYQNDVGNIWMLPFYRFTFYNHVASPNMAVPDCIGAWNSGDPAMGNGLFTARSYHPSGVNAIFADGHASFVGNGTVLAVWRALDTRNGGEAVEAPAGGY